jgi:hypothetical protein
MWETDGRPRGRESEDDDNAGNRALRGWRKPWAIFAFVGRLNQCSATIKMDGATILIVALHEPGSM